MNPNAISVQSPSGLMQDVAPPRPAQPVFSDVAPAPAPAQPLFNTAAAQVQQAQPAVNVMAPMPDPAPVPVMSQPMAPASPVMTPSEPMAQPAMPQPSPAAPVMQAAAPVVAQQPAHNKHAQHQTDPAHPKAEYPLLIIALAILVTAALAIAAVMVYRQGA